MQANSCRGFPFPPTVRVLSPRFPRLPSILPVWGPGSVYSPHFFLRWRRGIEFLGPPASVYLHSRGKKHGMRAPAVPSQNLQEGKIRK